MLLLVAVALFGAIAAFRPNARVAARTSLRALEKSSIDKLQEINDKYNRIINVDSPEANAEAAKLKETADKYAAYMNLNKLMAKMRILYETEPNDVRKE
jgi:DNA-binding protein H-NS